MLASSPMLISVLNSVLAGAILALAVLQLEGGTLAALVSGVVTFVLSMLAFLWYARRQIQGVRDEFVARFPGAPDGGAAATGESRTE
jgi:uncharacterized membrane protein